LNPNRPATASDRKKNHTSDELKPSTDAGIGSLKMPKKPYFSEDEAPAVSIITPREQTHRKFLPLNTTHARAKPHVGPIKASKQAHFKDNYHQSVAPILSHNDHTNHLPPLHTVAPKRNNSPSQKYIQFYNDLPSTHEDNLPSFDEYEASGLSV
jgi:hypothetical protein